MRMPMVVCFTALMVMSWHSQSLGVETSETGYEVEGVLESSAFPIASTGEWGMTIKWSFRVRRIAEAWSIQATIVSRGGELIRAHNEREGYNPDTELLWYGIEFDGTNILACARHAENTPWRSSRIDIRESSYPFAAREELNMLWFVFASSDYRTSELPLLWLWDPGPEIECFTVQSDVEVDDSTGLLRRARFERSSEPHDELLNMLSEQVRLEGYPAGTSMDERLAELRSWDSRVYRGEYSLSSTTNTFWGPIPSEFTFLRIHERAQGDTIVHRAVGRVTGVSAISDPSGVSIFPTHADIWVADSRFRSLKHGIDKITYMVTNTEPIVRSTDDQALVALFRAKQMEPAFFRPNPARRIVALVLFVFASAGVWYAMIRVRSLPKWKQPGA